MRRIFQPKILTVQKRNVHEHLKKEMGIAHKTNTKYVKDKFQKRNALPLLDWTKFKSFDESRYPGVDTEVIVVPKKPTKEWKPLTKEEAEKRQFYMKGIQGEEFIESNANDLIKQAFSWNTASQEEINQKNIQTAITRFQKKNGDTGSTPINNQENFYSDLFIKEKD
eukprot:gene7464-11788_t